MNNRLIEILCNVFLRGMETSEKNRKGIVMFPKALEKYIFLQVSKIILLFKK